MENPYANAQKTINKKQQKSSPIKNKPQTMPLSESIIKRVTTPPRKTLTINAIPKEVYDLFFIVKEKLNLSNTKMLEKILKYFNENN